MSFLNDLLKSPARDASRIGCSTPRLSPDGSDTDEDHLSKEDGQEPDGELLSSGTLGSNRGDISRSPSVTPQASNHRKRVSEDATQFAMSIGRRVRLRPNNVEELKEIAEMTASQQNVYLAALIMRNQELVELIQPAEAPYQVPASLVAKIEKYSFVLMLDPTISAYSDDHPCTQLIEFFHKYPGWGLTSHITEDPTKFKAIVAIIRKEFVTLRNLIKTKIAESIGKETEVEGTYDSVDILTLCQQIIAIRGKIAPKVKPSLQLCAHIAFLRCTFLSMRSSDGKVPRDFWPKGVDTALETIRTNKKGDAVKISDVFTRILTQDREIHGRANVEALVTDPLTVDSIVEAQEALEGCTDLL
ncbi:hypothetical protein H0H81_001935 [Sphagnurus paluster]|uniref:Uncharacterized protein n=1 Tax=Sphagnurus paluster TaxID=117069 RepID=A0A9P7GIA8_9AGAR|nr:hypothetical protein H0H81_001935 [Sphagnurus paluster]